MIQWLLSFGLSKGGVLVRCVVGYVIAAVASQHLVPNADLSAIQQGLESGGMALLTLAYAALQLWYHNHQAGQIKAIQTGLNSSL